MHIALCEERSFQPAADEQLNLSTDESYAPSIDWGSDPMEILMAKQELERGELEATFTRH